jgi:hypothetical protein
MKSVLTITKAVFTAIPNLIFWLFKRKKGVFSKTLITFAAQKLYTLKTITLTNNTEFIPQAYNYGKNYPRFGVH